MQIEIWGERRPGKEADLQRASKHGKSRKGFEPILADFQPTPTHDAQRPSVVHFVADGFDCQS